MNTVAGRAGTAVGVDVGGTRVRCARVARNGTVIAQTSEPVQRDRAGFQAQLLRLIRAMRADDSLAVGVGIPGRIEAPRGVIKSAGYLDIAGLDLPNLIVQETDLPARVENDATMALIAETNARADGRHGVLLMVTIGTGIGGAILVDGTPWYGGGIAGQFGHTVVAETGPPCKCGRTGCVETFSSGTALGRLIDDAGLPDDCRIEDLFARSETGDGNAVAVLERWARPCRRALETLVAVIDPQIIVMGGGLGAAMICALDRLPPRAGWFGLPVEPARLGDDAGVIGAGLCAFDDAEREPAG